MTWSLTGKHVCSIIQPPTESQAARLIQDTQQRSLTMGW
jgi:hypothetical protein